MEYKPQDYKGMTKKLNKRMAIVEMARGVDMCTVIENYERREQGRKSYREYCKNKKNK